jgi:acyl carrier protein
VVMLEEMPLTRNGKVDRRALPEAEVGASREYVEARSEVERELASIWGRVLKVERVGMYDNFFELGGHSLLAAQITSRIREAFHFHLSLREFFVEPTIAGLAAIIGTIESREDEAEKIGRVFDMISTLSDDEVTSLLHS